MIKDYRQLFQEKKELVRQRLRRISVSLRDEQRKKSLLRKRLNGRLYERLYEYRRLQKLRNADKSQLE